MAVSLLFWLAARPFEDRVATWSTGIGSLSKALGFVGIALMAWAVILAARLRLLEHLFGGLDRAYRHHHLIGGVAFILVLLHPTLMALRYASVSMTRASHLWLPTIQDWPLLWGQVALYLMTLALLATFFGRLRHVAFVRMQQLLGILLVPAFLHVATIRGDTRDFWPLRAYLLLLVGGAAAAYVYHPVLTRLLTSRRRYRVESVRALSSDVTELILVPAGRLMAFIPGQFAFITLHAVPPGDEAHPFSIASAPRASRLRFVVKHLGDWTSALPAVTSGTIATIEGPYGEFSHRFGRSTRQIWIAGGIGIAPFLSMATSLDDTPRYTIDLWYGHRGSDPFLDELRSYQAGIRGLRVFTVDEEQDGFITGAMLEARSGVAGTDVFICGPHQMMQSLREQLAELGVAEDRVHYEDFSFQ